MSTLIYITGQIDNPFFLNEIEDFVKRFDEVIVLSYAETENSQYLQIAQKYNFKYEILERKPCINEITPFLRLFFSKDTKEEIRVASRDGHLIKKIAYICIYILNAIKVTSHLQSYTFYDDVYVYSFWLSRGAYSATVLKKQYSVIKTISRAHGYDLFESRNELNYLPFRKKIANEIDEICFISKNGQDYFAKQCLLSNFKSHEHRVIHLGSRYPSAYREIVKSDSKIVFASCSSIIPLKRLDLIIDFIFQVRTQGQEVEWIHIGDGPQKEEIERLADKILKSGFTFLRRMNNSDVIAYYAENRIDFFINMSDNEGIPVSIMEAMSLGIPVIARNIGGVSEIVNPNTGILVESNGTVISEEYIDKVLELASNEEKYLAVSKGAYSFWEKEYDLKTNNNTLIDEFFQ